MLPRAALAIIAAIFLGLGTVSFSKLENYSLGHGLDLQERDALYLPRKEAVLFASLGYRDALAHLLWFKTINYFGREYKGAKNYQWLALMCDLVTSLSPKAEHVYSFCGTMLSWESEKPQASIEILNKAVEQFPEDWYFLYLRGFTYLYFLNDQAQGTRDIIASAGKPEAHPVVIRLAAKKLTLTQSPEAAIGFLTGAIRVSKDPTARAALTSRLDEAYYELGFQLIERAVQQHQETKGHAPSTLLELEQEGLIPKELSQAKYRDPYGGTYALTPGTAEVTSSSKKPRTRLRWNKTPLPEGRGQ